MPAPEPPRVVVYRDHLLPFSETFILSQSGALREHTPILVGRKRVAGAALDGQEAAVAAREGWRGALEQAQHLCGRPPRHLIETLAARSPVLLHAHFGPDALNALPLARSLEVPLLVTFHGYDATQRATLRGGPQAWRYTRRRRGLAGHAGALLAVSEHIRRSLIVAGLPEERIRTHYIGVDLGKFKPAALERREKIVLGVGRFVEKKGFDVLIDAMAEVQRRAPEVRLVLIGDGPLGRALRERAGRVLRSHAILGPCEPDVVRAWMARARVLAVPSVTSSSGDTEGLPITLLEALASGLPAVASRHAGMPEAVEDGVCGFLVPEGDARALAARLLEVLADDARWRSLSACAREAAERRFDLAAQTAALEAIYAELQA